MQSSVAGRVGCIQCAYDYLVLAAVTPAPTDDGDEALPLHGKIN